MNPGDILRDNDPRMYGRKLTVVKPPVMTHRGLERLQAKDSGGHLFWIAAKRIHADGKPRRSGFTLERRNVQ